MRKKKNKQLKKLLTMMRILYLAQFILVIGVIAFLGIRYFIAREIPTEMTYIILLSIFFIMVITNGYFVLRDNTLFGRLRQQIEIKDESYKNIEALNLELRAQRHDFLNHLQILYSLMELEEFEETTNYLNQLYGDVGKLSANIKTRSIAINALLQAKANEAESMGIEYETVINTRLDRMGIPDWELCRVLSNLIDNGFEAASQVSGQKLVKVHIKENITDYIIEVRNTSVMLTDAIIKKLSVAGFTTKKNGKNHGMGLYIINEIIQKYGHHMTMQYDDGFVVVTLTIHKDDN